MRYAAKAEALRTTFSEFGLMRARVTVEVRWLQHLASIEAGREGPPLSPDAEALLDGIVAGFSLEDALAIKAIEAKTNHDVKAVEYFIKARTGAALGKAAEFIHFACTSEDINNVSHALMLKDAVNESLLPQLDHLIGRLRELEHRAPSP